MASSTVFMNNRTQAVRLPAEMRFEKNIRKVTIRKQGSDRVISPEGSSWDSFFLGPSVEVSSDFMEERDPGQEAEREAI